MIHTLQFYCYATLDEIKASEEYHALAIQEVLAKVESSYSGIKITFKKLRFSNDYIFYLFIDAIKLLDKADITQLDQIPLQNQLNDIKKNLLFTNKDLILLRIDYRFDVKISDERIRNFLFNLFAKNIDYFKYLKRCEGKKKSTYSPGEKYKSSLYYNSKSIIALVYDKPKERQAKHQVPKSYETDILRFELRLLNNHLKYRKHTYHIEKTLENYMTDDMYQKYMADYILQIFYFGDFYSIRKARSIIQASSLTKREQKELDDFLIKVSKYGLESLVKRRHTTSSYGLSRYKLRKLLDQLKQLSINPILIPVNAHQIPSHIPNPLNSLIFPHK